VAARQATSDGRGLTTGLERGRAAGTGYAHTADLTEAGLLPGAIISCGRAPGA
jgi:hypothetical protein